MVHHGATDIVTFRLNWPRGRCNKNLKFYIYSIEIQVLDLENQRSLQKCYWTHSKTFLKYASWQQFSGFFSGMAPPVLSWILLYPVLCSKPFHQNRNIINTIIGDIYSTYQTHKNPIFTYKRVQPFGLISLSCNWVILDKEIDQM